MSEFQSVRLRKAARVVGKTLSFRNACIDDAVFILSLRTDPGKSRFLSSVTGAIEDQRDWLARYALAENQAYFIIEYQNEPIGTVRLYDPQEGSFCWGSWILASNRPTQAAMESALMVYAYALDYLGFTAAHFDVRKGNERVWQFHERFGAVRTSSTDSDYLYSLSRSAIQMSRERYKKFLPNGVTVEALGS